MPDPLRILLAPDAFKGSLDAREFCRVAAEVLAEVLPDAEIVHCPLADGGEGSLKLWAAATDAALNSERTIDALGRPCTATWARSRDGRLGVVELAAASGLGGLDAAELDPLAATTRGTGELMRYALRSGCRTVTVTLGGSATVDGGVGALTALGFRFLDDGGEPIPAGGQGLRLLDRIDWSGVEERVDSVRWVAAADVRNPLLGPQGAVAVYGPQKGAGPGARARLEEGLARFARVAGRIELAERAGTGAAGGCGFGFAALLGAELVSGFDWLAEAVGLNRQLDRCDLVITGEGRFDAQSLSGKVVGEVLKRARVRGRRVLVLAGEASPDAPLPPETELITLVGPGADARQARRQPAPLLARRIRDWAAALAAGGRRP